MHPTAHPAHPHHACLAADCRRRHRVDLVRRYVDEIVLVTDDEIRATLHTLWQELEGSASRYGVTPVAAVLRGRVPTPTSGSVCAIVGASGEEGLF